jgi:hypothetical protein
MLYLNLFAGQPVTLSLFCKIRFAKQNSIHTRYNMEPIPRVTVRRGIKVPRARNSVHRVWLVGLYKVAERERQPQPANPTTSTFNYWSCSLVASSITHRGPCYFLSFQPSDASSTAVSLQVPPAGASVVQHAGHRSRRPVSHRYLRSASSKFFCGF